MNAREARQILDPEELWPHRACAVCQAKQSRLLFQQRFVPMSAGSLLTGYNVVACDHCGFCYADHLPAQPAFDAYYHDMSKYEQLVGPAKPSRFDLQRFQATVQKIQGFMPDKNARILEVGCATGLLLAQLKHTDYGRVTGLDPSPACGRAAKELYDVPVRCGGLSDGVAEAGTVDLLIMVGVLEHIRDLSAALQKVTRVLSPGGRVFVTIPDASRYAVGDDAPFQEFSLEHINYFGPGSLANLMAVHGFSTLFLEQSMQAVNERTITPVIHAAFEKLATPQSANGVVRHEDTCRGLQEYITKSGRENDAIQPVLAELASSQQPVIVWGAGSHTLRLLATSPLAQAKITSIIDSNPRYEGKTIIGIPIVRPTALSHLPGTILISSRVFQNDIRRQIMTGLKLGNPIITLYDLEPAPDQSL